MGARRPEAACRPVVARTRVPTSARGVRAAARVVQGRSGGVARAAARLVAKSVARRSLGTVLGLACAVMVASEPATASRTKGAWTGTWTATLPMASPRHSRPAALIMNAWNASTRSAAADDAEGMLRILEARALEALLSEGPGGATMPTVSAPVPLEAESARAVLLCAPRPAPESALQSVRAGARARGRWAPATEDLRAMARLLVLEPLVAALEPEVRLSPAAIASILEGLPAPPLHPGADRAALEEARRLARARRSDARTKAAVERLRSRLGEACASGIAWRDRFDGMVAALERACDGAASLALVRIGAARRLAESGWSLRREDDLAFVASESAPDPERRLDRAREARRAIAKAIEAASAESPAETAFWRAVAAVEPIAVERLESIDVSAGGRVDAAFREIGVDLRTATGWRTAAGAPPDGLRWRGRERPSVPRRRLRDAPFGVKPLGSFPTSGCPPATLAPMAEPSRHLRQMQLPGFGAEGQRRIAHARVFVAGCGALGTVVVEQLARAGVGTLVVVDRDVVERSNLQRQTLFTERDAERGVPKAEAAKARVSAIDAGVVVRAVVDDLSGGNALRHAEGCDLVVDCLDNFETRYLLNDLAVSTGRPMVYGGAVGLRGMAAMLLPSTGAGRDRAIRWTAAQSTPCLRCLAPEPPAPGEVETCDTAGVLAAAPGIVGSLEAAFSLRTLAAGGPASPSRLVRFDLASSSFVDTDLAVARDPDCPCCARGAFPHLAARVAGARVLCGRDAVEVRVGEGSAGCFDAALSSLSRLGPVERSTHGDTRRATLGAEAAGTIGCRGLALLEGASGLLVLVEGVDEPDRARSIVARAVGL